MTHNRMESIGRYKVSLESHNYHWRYNMSDIKTREFAGFQIEDSNNFVMTLNSKNGPVDLNCQEIMSTAISKNAVFGNGQADNDIVQITGNSYNLISQLRSSEKWILAKASFESLNPNLTDTQKSKIKPKNSSNGNSGNGEDKIKFTATHKQNLGEMIFESLPTNQRKYLSNFDLSNSAYAEDTHMGKVVRQGAEYFARGVQVAISAIVYESNRAERERAEQERVEREQKLQNKAIGMLKVMGIVEPDNKESESYDTDMQEYQDKISGILIFLSEDSE